LRLLHAQRNIQQDQQEMEKPSHGQGTGRA
jgi:hypothetical protein